MKLAFTSLIVTLAPALAFVSPTNIQLTRQESMQVSMQNDNRESESPVESFAKVALASLVSLSILSNPLPALADGQTEKFKLPPIDFADKNRCSLSSSSIGQANAARDKLYDLRQCSLSDASAPGFDLSGVIMTKTDVSKADFKEAYFSKGYLHGTSFR